MMSGKGEKTPACRLCGEQTRQPFLILKNSPANISGVLRPEQFSRDIPIDLTIWRCNACGFVQLDPLFAETFYDEYVMTTTHSPQMQALQERQSRDFVETFSLQGKCVFEAGCGDGNYLGWLKKAGANVVGVEPSNRFRKLAVDRGFTVHSSYIHATTLVPGAPFDAFVTRQVLEHVPDPHDFLVGIRNSLTADGVGLVEVPSLEQAMEGYRFYDFFPDHLNYFSDRTLRLVLQSAGFEVIRTWRDMGGEYNLAWVKVAAEFGFNKFQSVLGEIIGQLRTWVSNLQDNGKRVAVWGAGGKGLSSMAVAQLKNIAYVVDSDPFKHGLFTPIGHFPIVAPEQLSTDPVDAIILTALAYKNEILKDLRNRIGFRGPVLLLGRDIEVLTTADQPSC